jgi:diguanylate cyclase (GGDEF)-like protein/PAS domain S-box-containing protein
MTRLIVDSNEPQDWRKLRALLEAFLRDHGYDLSVVEDGSEGISNRIDTDKPLRLTQISIDRMADAAFWMDRQARFIYVNDQACQSLGYSRQELLSMRVHDIDPQMPEELWPDHWAELKRRGSFIFESQHRAKDGSVFPVEVRVNYVKFDGEEYNCAFARDITVRLQTEETIRRLAYQDYLTGLPNRRLFDDRAKVALANAERHQQNLAVMMIDLDYFKEVNDSFGHSFGDQLLQAVGGRLKNLLRKGDTVARMGGDEFMILLPALTSCEVAGRVAQKILEAVRQPFMLSGHDLNVTTSVGIAIYPMDGKDRETLVKNADKALYCAKDQGRDNFQCYSSSGSRVESTQ